MTWHRYFLDLSPKPRGLHLVTREVSQALETLPKVKIGLLHVFVQHTSASLSINENADSDVRRDLASLVDSLAPEDFPYRHTAEGPDDMPAHAKSSLLVCA